MLLSALSDYRLRWSAQSVTASNDRIIRGMLRGSVSLRDSFSHFKLVFILNIYYFNIVRPAGPQYSCRLYWVWFEKILHHHDAPNKIYPSYFVLIWKSREKNSNYLPHTIVSLTLTEREERGNVVYYVNVWYLDMLLWWLGVPLWSNEGSA